MDYHSINVKSFNVGNDLCGKQTFGTKAIIWYIPHGLFCSLSYYNNNNPNRRITLEEFRCFEIDLGDLQPLLTLSLLATPSVPK